MGYDAIYIYFLVVLVVTLITLAASALFPSIKTSPTKFESYESGIRVKNHLLEKRFPIRHYLVGLLFLLFDIEVVFLYPWAVVAKDIGPFAFFEMAFFLVISLIGFIYVWKKGGLEWQ